MTTLTERPEWQALKKHQQELKDVHLRDLFVNDPERCQRFSLSMGPIFLDFSRNRITEATLNLLLQLADATNLSEKIREMFAGKSINYTENRPVLHSALRDKNQSSLVISEQTIAENIAAAREKMREFTAKIHTKKHLGATGKPIKHIVNIGIGGSYLGPMMTVEALKDFAVSDLDFHFISSVDDAKINDLFAEIDPEKALFIISSKSFSTLETLTNAATILKKMQEKIGNHVIENHFVAVTANAKKAREFGLSDHQIFPIWDWIGGRYSIWSAIGLPLLLMIGDQHFQAFLDGAFAVDQHFQSAPLTKNIPVMLALLSVWYCNFFAASAQAIIPYSHRLRFLVSYLQQADMESNGKTVTSTGIPANYATGPIIFGEEGCHGQHAFHQLLHQGQHLIPADIILIAKSPDQTHHHDLLLASGLSQAHALMYGKTIDEAYAELFAANVSETEAQRLAAHLVIPGNKPSNILVLSELSPESLGALIALYEHKIFVSGVLWDINSFDQFGVELGKKLLPTILNQITQDGKTLSNEAVLTKNIIDQIKKFREKS